MIRLSPSKFQAHPRLPKGHGLLANIYASSLSYLPGDDDVDDTAITTLSFTLLVNLISSSYAFSIPFSTSFSPSSSSSLLDFLFPMLSCRTKRCHDDFKCGLMYERSFRPYSKFYH
jgi:hypothetical protein